MGKTLLSMTREEFDTMAQSHDSGLSARGPYSKVTAGVSHIFSKDRGAAFELSVFPSVYRGRSQLPTATVQSNYHPWYASADLSVYTYRFQLEWKDRVCCDVSYLRLCEDAVLVELDAHNETDLPQQLGVHYLASMQFPKDGPGFARWLRPECSAPACALIPQPLGGESPPCWSPWHREITG